MADRPSTIAAYRAVLGSRLRSQLVYRTSFALDLTGSAMIATTDFAEVYVVFHNIKVLGGLDLGGACLVFGLGTVGFALANAVCGQLDTMPELIRTGRIEALMLRPQPLLAQLITSDVTLKRIGGAVVGLIVLAYGLASADLHWTAARVALLLLTPVSGAGVFSALFVAAGAIQFWLIDAAEITNSFTYGSSYAARYSAAVLPVPVRLLFAFVMPAAFTAYLPTLVLLGRPGPAWLPAWLGWWTPLVAVAAWTAALLLWRRGVRHYTGAGG